MHYWGHSNNLVGQCSLALIAISGDVIAENDYLCSLALVPDPEELLKHL